MKMMAIHGARAGDMLRLIDGMRWNGMEVASGTGFGVVAAMAEEINLKLGSNSAEFELGGVNINLIPKEGATPSRDTFLPPTRTTICNATI